MKTTPSEKMTQAFPVTVPVWKSGTCWGLVAFGVIMLVWEIDVWCSGTVFIRFKVVFDWLKIVLDWFVGHPAISFPCLYLLGHFYWPNRKELVSARRYKEETRVEGPERDADTCIRGSTEG